MTGQDLDTIEPGHWILDWIDWTGYWTGYWTG